MHSPDNWATLQLKDLSRVCLKHCIIFCFYYTHLFNDIKTTWHKNTEKSLVIVMLFCLFWGWDKISCNWVWGPETACSHDVWATICHYTICQYCFQQTGSPQNQRRTWQWHFFSDILLEEDILAHPHYVVRLFEGLHLVLGLELRAYAHWVSFFGSKIDANNNNKKNKQKNNLM